MFDALSQRLESAWKKLRGQDKISTSNIQDALREVRRALLEADVNLQVVKDFISEVETKHKVLMSLLVCDLTNSSSKLFTMSWCR
jgi:signal recognition particle GTPase